MLYCCQIYKDISQNRRILLPILEWVRCWMGGFTTSFQITGKWPLVRCRELHEVVRCGGTYLAMYVLLWVLKDLQVYSFSTHSVHVHNICFFFYITGSFWWQILMRTSNAKNVSVKYSRSALNLSIKRAQTCNTRLWTAISEKIEWP